MPAGENTQVKVQSQLPVLRLAVGVGSLLCIIALLALPSFAPWLTRIDYWTADWRTAYLSRSEASQNEQIAIVAINDDTLKDYVSSPIDRGLLAKIIKAVDDAGAAAIGLDIFFLKATEPGKDAALLEAIGNARAKIVLGGIDERGDLQPFQRQFQTAFLAGPRRPAGYLNLRHERDDVVRYTASPQPGSAYPRSFARLLVEAAGAASADDAGKPISWLLKAKDGSDAFLKIQAQELLPASGGAAAPGAQAGRLKGRIVLIGGDFPLRDRHRVPLSVRDGEPVPGVAIHAHVVAGLLAPARAIAELHPISVRLVLAFVALCGFMLGWTLWQSAVVSFVGWSFASAVLVAIDALFFVQLQTLLPFTLILVAWVCGLSAGRSLHFAGDPLLSRWGSRT
jgi:adenylate cyclase